MYACYGLIITVCCYWLIVTVCLLWVDCYCMQLSSTITITLFIDHVKYFRYHHTDPPSLDIILPLTTPSHHPLSPPPLTTPSHHPLSPPLLYRWPSSITRTVTSIPPSLDIILPLTPPSHHPLSIGGHHLSRGR